MYCLSCFSLRLSIIHVRFVYQKRILRDLQSRTAFHLTWSITTCEINSKKNPAELVKS